MVRRLRQSVLAAMAGCSMLGAAAVGLQAAADPAGSGGRSASTPRAEALVCTLQASPIGSDTRGNGTRLMPFRTPQRLLRSLPAGGTGCLRNGRYTGAVTLVRDRTTLRSVPGQRAVLATSTLTIPKGVDGATVSHLDLAGGSGALTVRAVGNGFTLARNDITNGRRGASCVLVGASDHRTLGGRVVENVIHGCGRDGSHYDHGIYAQNVGPAPGGSGLLIEGNVLYDNAGYAVQLFPSSKWTRVRDNVIDGGGRSVRGGIVLDGRESTGHVIEGNVIARAKTPAVVQRTGSGHVSRSNCLWRNADGVTGPGITSTGDQERDACWLSDELWAATGAAAAREPCVCPSRRPADCSRAQADALCRLLKEEAS